MIAIKMTEHAVTRESSQLLPMILQTAQTARIGALMIPEVR